MDSVRAKRAKNHGQAITVKEKRATRVQIDQAQLPKKISEGDDQNDNTGNGSLF
jgi:hypothetical protein